MKAKSSGNALAVMVRQDKGRIQFVIVGGPMPKGNDLCELEFLKSLETLHTSRWFDTEEEARAATMPVYFGLYEKIEGFKHPEDPQVAAPSMEGSSR